MSGERERWIRKYRSDFGCKAGPYEACWCSVCCALDRAWEEELRIVIGQIAQIRHPSSGDIKFEKPVKSQPSVDMVV